jgi:hypothetical protein
VQFAISLAYLERTYEIMAQNLNERIVANALIKNVRRAICRFRGYDRLTAAKLKRLLHRIAEILKQCPHESSSPRDSPHSCGDELSSTCDTPLLGPKGRRATVGQASVQVPGQTLQCRAGVSCPRNAEARHDPQQILQKQIRKTRCSICVLRSWPRTPSNAGRFAEGSALDAR